MESTDRWNETMRKKRRNWLLYILFVVGLGLRLHGYDWGLPHHFHPDERQIVDFQAPKVDMEILNPAKSVPLLMKGEWAKLNDMLFKMNTKFFAYGPLPMYTLVATVEIQERMNAQIRSFASARKSWSAETKTRINNLFPRVKDGRGRIVTGRMIAGFLSALTILVVFRLGRYLYNPKVGYLAAAFFTFTVLSIQQAHFMIVDGPQTFLVALAMYHIVRIAMGERRRDYYLAAVFIGLAMATKFSTAPIALPYILAHILSMTRGRRRGSGNWYHWIAGGLLAVAVMTIVMPFWLLDSAKFFQDIRSQRDMVTGVADLPYTIQFENTAPFVYMIKNMIRWSLGIPLGLAAFAGLIAAVRRIWKKPEDLGNIVILAFVLPLLYLNGVFYAKFLRYTLVVFPFMVLFASRWLYGMKNWAGRGWSRFVTITVLIGTIGWALAFQNIYREPHTRIQASDWMYDNIPSGSNVIQESSWDDGLPVSTGKGNAARYSIRQLGIYKEPDNEQRAAAMAEILEWGDVVVLSSRKHYGSVSRVPNRYPVSSNFYKLLFDEALGFQHVKTFDNPPSLGRLTFRDDRADESFRVYEHPRVDVFVRESALSASRIQALLMAPPSHVADMTYDELMTRRPPTEIGSRVNFPILRWLLALEILGFIAIPFTFVIFGQFDHKGYPFAKLTGLLVAGYLCWFLPSIRWFPFSRTLIVGVLILLAWLSHCVYRANRAEIRKMFRERWWSIAGYEVLFLLVFLIFGLLKSYNPDIYWSESSMDFGFMNAVVRAEYFPPEDPWIQGQGINYYYYGQYLAGFLTVLTGVEPHYGYNLFFITIPAVVSLSIAAILIALTRRIWVALAGVLFSIFIGNLDGVPQMANIWVRHARGTALADYAGAFQTAVGYVFNLGRQDPNFRFFRSAHELIKPTVHEFPFWSYNFMDLHAHTIATMLTAFFLALQLVLLRHCKHGISLFGKTPLQQGMTLGVLWISYGAMISTNSWDLPTQVLMLILVSLWIMAFANRKPGFKRDEILTGSLRVSVGKQNEIVSYGSEDREYDASDASDGWDAGSPEMTSEDAEETDAKVLADASENMDESGVEPDETEPDHVFSDDTERASASLEETQEENVIAPEENSDTDVKPQQDDLSDDVDQGRTWAESAPDDIEQALHLDIDGGFHTTEDIAPESIGKPEAGSPALTETPPFAPPVKPQPWNVVKTRVAVFVNALKKVPPWMGRELLDSGKFLWYLLWPVALIVMGAMTLHLPYLMNFYRQGMGIGTLWKYRQTTNMDGFLTMFGFFIFIITTQLVRWWWDVQKERGRSRTKALCLLMGVITLLLLVWFGFQTLPQTLNIKGADFSVLIFSVFLLILILWILIEGYPTANETFPLILALVATGITAGCELVFVRDFYQGGEMRRFNTIFKFYLQAWFMFAIVSAYLLARRTRIRYSSVKSGFGRIVTRIGSWSWSIVFILLLAGSLIFTFWGVYARHHNGDFQQQFLSPRNRHGSSRIPLTLDGWAYMKLGFRPVNEYRAIDWLQKNVSGTPVILEASGADYLYQFGNISGNTGLPTVLGWWSHVEQREYLVKRNRGKNRRDRNLDTGKIKRDIVTMYNSADISTVLSLLGQYRVEYVFVGPTEKKEYSELGLEKFRQMSAFMTPVYTNPDVVIYRVNDYGHSADLADMIQDSQALRDLSEELEAREQMEQQAARQAEMEREKRMMDQAPRSLLRGSQGKARGMYEEPRSLCVAPDGSVYIADFRNHRVQKFDSDGEWVAMWGSTGSEPGQFNDICDVAANTRYVYVLDTFHNRIQMFSHEGKLMSIIVPDDVSVSHPRGIAADDAHIFLSDTGNSKIIRMNISGQDVRVFGRPGKGPMQFANPVGIAIHNDEVYVADTNNRRVQVMTRDGQFLREYAVKGWEAEVFNEPYVCVEQNGTIWYSDPSRGVVTSIDQDGNMIREWTASIDGLRFGLPMGLGVRLNGDVIVVDARNHTIMRITRGQAPQSPESANQASGSGNPPSGKVGSDSVSSGGAGSNGVGTRAKR